MIHGNLEISKLLKVSEGKTLICFGAGKHLLRVCEWFKDLSFFDKIDMIADNDSNKHIFSFGEQERAVYPIETCISKADKEPIILITTVDCLNIVSQLDSIPALDNYYCLVSSFVLDAVIPYRLPIDRAKGEQTKIPKIIHYSWFGGNKLPDKFETNVKSWKKYCPDYEIVFWNEGNYDYNKHEYTHAVSEQGRWSAVANYARLDIIHSYGGVYLDVDVEMIKNIDDLLCDEAFCGFASRMYVNNGSGFGAVAGFPLVKEQLDVYNSGILMNEDGLPDMTTGPECQTDFFKSKGLILDNSLQKIDGMTVYPSDVLSPMSHATGKLNKTSNTHAIHHYEWTWGNKSALHKRKKSKAIYEALKDFTVYLPIDEKAK